MTTTPPETETGSTVEAPQAKESFGTWLRRQRELREIALREIADTSKISLRYLQALENDRFDILPAPVFAKGFLRQYAKYVGLDPEETVNFYLAADSQHEDARDETESIQRRPRTLGFWPYFLATLVLVLLLLIVYWALIRLNRSASGETGDSGDGSVFVPPSTLSADTRLPGSAPWRESTSGPGAPARRPAASEEPDAPLFVTLDFHGDCRVQAAVDGGTWLDRVYTQGESLQLPARDEVVIELENSDDVEMEVNGYAVDLDDGSTPTGRRLRIDLETAAALRQGRQE